MPSPPVAGATDVRSDSDRSSRIMAQATVATGAETESTNARARLHS